MSYKFMMFTLVFLSIYADDEPRKIPLYTFYTPSHEVFKDEWFLPSLQDDFDLHIEYVPQEGEGRYREKDYDEAIIKKVDLIISALEENYQGIVIYSDIDVQFFKPVKDILLALLQDYDLLVQRDSPDGKLCAGFFITRSNEKTLALWRTIKEEMLRDGKYSDQRILNSILLRRRREHPIAWNYLPRQFLGGGTLTGKAWNPGDSLIVPPDIVMHHANWTIGVPNKIAQLAYVKRTVLAQQFFEDVVRNALNGWADSE